MQVFLASSPFHVFVASAVALHLKQQKQYCTLWLVGCSVESMSFMVEVLQTNNVFESIVFLPENRKKAIDDIKQRLSFLSIERIFVGNDRHVEFQFLAQNSGVKCIYLDDGLYSYIGRESSQTFSEQVVNNWLKKLAYGFWWKTPKTVGGSAYIDQAWLFFPQLKHELITSESRALDQSWFLSKTYLHLMEAWLEAFKLSSDLLESFDVVYTLPDEKDMNQMPNYEQKVSEFIEHCVETGKNIAVKYHPNTLEDVLALKDRFGVVILPAKLPFETMLPFLRKAELYADVSTTLLMAKFLQPEMKIVVVKEKGYSASAATTDLMQRIGVEVQSFD